MFHKALTNMKDSLEIQKELLLVSILDILTYKLMFFNLFVKRRSLCEISSGLLLTASLSLSRSDLIK